MLLVRALSIAALAVAVAGAQIAGGVHRIEHAQKSSAPRAGWHASWQHDHGADPVHLSAHEDGRKPVHDCAAYDAATLGNGPPIARPLLLADPAPEAALTAAAFTVADNSPHLPFQSRAPPRA